MGTLFAQPVKARPPLEDAIDEILVQVKRLQKMGYSPSDAVGIVEVAQNELAAFVELGRQDSLDEQLAGFGVIAVDLVSNLSRE